jgi:hypothetical protein
VVSWGCWREVRCLDRARATEEVVQLVWMWWRVLVESGVV